MTNLCRTISNLPVHNAKQRLSQSEIAKKVSRLGSSHYCEHENALLRLFYMQGIYFAKYFGGGGGGENDQKGKKMVLV